jgi:hypothetical protein
MMGWLRLHSLFSPLRRMWVRAHSERRNRKSSSFCCVLGRLLASCIALALALKNIAFFSFLFACAAREGDAHPVQGRAVLPGRGRARALVHPHRLPPPPPPPPGRPRARALKKNLISAMACTYVFMHVGSMCDQESTALAFHYSFRKRRKRTQRLKKKRDREREVFNSMLLCAAVFLFFFLHLCAVLEKNECEVELSVHRHTRTLAQVPYLQFYRTYCTVYTLCSLCIFIACISDGSLIVRLVYQPLPFFVVVVTPSFFFRLPVHFCLMGALTTTRPRPLAHGWPCAHVHIDRCFYVIQHKYNLGCVVFLSILSQIAGTETSIFQRKQPAGWLADTLCYCRIFIAS